MDIKTELGINKLKHEVLSAYTAMTKTIFCNTIDDGFPSISEIMKITSNYEDLPKSMILNEKFKGLSKNELYKQMLKIYLDNLYPETIDRLLVLNKYIDGFLKEMKN